MRGVGCFSDATFARQNGWVSVPLRGVGCFLPSARLSPPSWFPSPCGVWVVSLHPGDRLHQEEFPSPCGVWVVSGRSGRHGMQRGFRPLAGCGLFPTLYFEPRRYSAFPSPCGVWVVSGSKQPRRPRSAKVSVPLRGVGCFGKAAHSFWCNRKKNCQLCYFIVSYWQMFINSKLRNCKVPCEAHKTAT